MLNYDSIFFDNFVLFLSKTAAKISQFLVMVALQKLHHQRNVLRFSAFATSYPILTENRQAKPGRFQIRSVEKLPSYTFYTLGTILK